MIDDRLDLREAWESAGGIFIHHVTGDARRTVRQLRAHGILPPPERLDGDGNDKNQLSWSRSSIHP